MRGNVDFIPTCNCHIKKLSAKLTGVNASKKSIESIFNSAVHDQTKTTKSDASQ